MFPTTHYRQQLDALPMRSIQPEALVIHHSPDAFKRRLLELIASARQRIYLVALYLQDDEAGREILDALYAAKRIRPELDIQILVDFHRAQRGLIGKGKQSGNHRLYQALAAANPEQVIPVHGVPVKRREWLGVLHLKGFVFDDTLLYSGASLNNIYLHQQARYRYDRYHEIRNAALADSMVAFIRHHLIAEAAVQRLDQPAIPPVRQFKLALRQFRQQLEQARYRIAPTPLGPGQVGICPLVGLGKRDNQLNEVVQQLLRGAQEEVFICTPYFNPPRGLAQDLRKLLKRGVKLTLVVGDKTANDFYIPPEEPFSPIGGLPYLYESNLRRFCQHYQRRIDSGQLNIMLWKHDANSYHLKGIFVDGDLSLITGSNLNPRAWTLDLENGLLLRDPEGLLKAQFDDEKACILTHTRRLSHYGQLEQLKDYPEQVRRLLTRLQRFKAHLLLRQIL